MKKSSTKKSAAHASHLSHIAMAVGLFLFSTALFSVSTAYGALVINTNTAALNAMNRLQTTQTMLSTNFARLSSGMRINTAADDAAGLGISKSIEAQTRSFAVAEREAKDGISMLQTADTTAQQISKLLIRMRELAVQGSNGTLAPSNGPPVQTEFDQLKDSIATLCDRESATTTSDNASDNASPSTLLSAVPQQTENLFFQRMQDISDAIDATDLPIIEEDDPTDTPANDETATNTTVPSPSVIAVIDQSLKDLDVAEKAVIRTATAIAKRTEQANTATSRLIKKLPKRKATTTMPVNSQ